MSDLPGTLATINWHWVWLVAAAFLAGVLNAVAGGGSFLSFPALLGMNMLPVQANATNTVAIWPGQLTSVAAYRQDVRKNLRAALLMGLAGLVGGTAGAVVLLNTPQKTFMHLVPWLLLFAASTFAVSGPVARALERLKFKRHANAGIGETHAPRRLPLFVATTVVSFYVGGHPRHQRAQGSSQSAGQRHRVCHFYRGWPSGVALLPGGDGGGCHRRIHFGEPGAPRSATGAARARGGDRPVDGGVVLLEAVSNDQKKGLEKRGKEMACF